MEEYKDDALKRIYRRYISNARSVVESFLDSILPLLQLNSQLQMLQYERAIEKADELLKELSS